MNTLIYYEHSTGPTDLVIPNGVKIIGRHSFYNCDRIKTVIIPRSAVIIGYNPFANCPSLTLINHSPNFIYKSGALFDRQGAELIYYSIAACEQEIVIPPTVRSIGRSAFSKCAALESIIIPEGVTIINKTAFAQCSGLKSVLLPRSLKTIDGLAFAHCSSLKEIEIPIHTTVAANAFMDCPIEIGRK